MIASHNDHASAPRPYCQSTDIVRHGTTSEGKQRYRYRRDSGYCAGVTRQSGHHHQRTQKKASALQQVNQACCNTCTPSRGRLSSVVLTNSICHNCRWTQLDINDIVRQTTHVERRRSCVCSKRCSVRLRGARGTGWLPQDNTCPRQGSAMRCL